MTLRPGDIAPDFEQNTTLGRIRFHKRLGNSWGVLFSHPADFTPVCTTELGLTAKLEKEFDQRNGSSRRGYRAGPLDLSLQQISIAVLLGSSSWSPPLACLHQWQSRGLRLQ